MTDYNAIFTAFEDSLFRYSSLSAVKLRQKFDTFRIDDSTSFNDPEYYHRLITSIFYAGMKAEIVTRRLPIIRSYFSDWKKASTYTESEIHGMLSDSSMLRNRRKIESAISSSQVFRDIVDEYGSFRNYLKSFDANTSFENLMLLKEEIEFRFSGLGRINTYHFMTEIGLPVLKPDRVLQRIFLRLELIENKGQLLKTIIQGRKFAAATGHPIRYIDIIFVTYGQVSNTDFGIPQGICLKENPACYHCDASIYCSYYQERTKRE